MDAMDPNTLQQNKRRKPKHTNRTHKRKHGKKYNTQENTQLKDIPPILQQIRKKSQLYKAQQQFPKITYMILKDYTIQEINNSIKKLKKTNKAHGADGIPAEAYKTIQTWLAEPLTDMINEIKNGKQLPTTWKNGAVVHIYKNKGGGKECDNYRPISLLQIAYKIWPSLIAQRLAKILRILTSNNQYGYKNNVSTIDAIVKIEQYIGQNKDTQNILLMDLAKAFDAVSRKILWGTLYKKRGPPYK